MHLFIESKEESLISMNISPNPFEDKIYLNLNLKRDGNIQVDIYNILGQLVYNRQETLSTGTHSLTIDDLPNTADGFLMVSVSDGINTFTQKLIKTD